MPNLRTFVIATFLVIALGAQADTYTILFNSSTSDSSSPIENAKQEDWLNTIVLSSTSNMVVDVPAISKIYRAKEGYGIKGATGKDPGEITLKLDQTYYPKQLTVVAAAYNNKSDATSTHGLKVQDQSFVWRAPYTELQEYTINIGQEGVREIKISSLTEKNNRFYIQQIRFDAPDPNPSQAKLTTPSKLEFANVPFEPGVDEEAEDMESLSIIGKCISGEGINLSLYSGKIFSISPSKLPAEGGDITVSYHLTSIGSFTDTLNVSATGSNYVEITHRIPLKVTAFKYVPKPIDSSSMVIGPMSCEYYMAADGLKDSVLKSTLGTIINRGIRYRYGSGRHKTWDGFFYTDRDTLTNEVMDMYSNNHRYFNQEKPTASVAEFDIEHMLPKSWWGGIVNDAYNDLFHLVPGDYSANRSKSNHAPGIVTDTTFWNGSFAVGRDAIHGLEKVFSPADEYKGDFARAYFYIACCYGDSLKWVQTSDSEPAAAMTNTSYQEFRPWLRDLLLTWHRQDPVSEKELQRAIEVNKLQGNRNPFIDYPELVEYIWGDKIGQEVDFTKLTQSYGVECKDDPTQLPLQSISATDALKRLEAGQIVIIRQGKRYTLLGIRL